MSAVSKRKPLQRPFVGVLAVVIQRAVEVDGNNPYEQARWLQRAVDRNKGVHALLDESERLWMECRSSVVALDDAAYVQHACDALAAMLQAIMWVVTLRQAPGRPGALAGGGVARGAAAHHAALAGVAQPLHGGAGSGGEHAERGAAHGVCAGQAA